VRTRVYIAQRSPPVLRSEDSERRGGHPKDNTPEDNQQPPGEPIPAQLRNGNLFASLNDDDSAPYVSDMVFMSNLPVPLGTLYI